MIDIDTTDSGAIADTKRLQWESVVLFMKAYRYFPGRGKFIHIEDRLHSISANSAIQLHNDLRMKNDNRLVAKAKLQWSKKNKSLICQSNIVKMMNGNKLEDWVAVGASVDA